MAEAFGWMNCTLLPAPMENVRQSMTALALLWVMTTWLGAGAAKLTLPARTVAPLGTCARAGVTQLKLMPATSAAKRQLVCLTVETRRSERGLRFIIRTRGQGEG